MGENAPSSSQILVVLFLACGCIILICTYLVTLCCSLLSEISSTSLLQGHLLLNALHMFLPEEPVDRGVLVAAGPMNAQSRTRMVLPAAAAGTSYNPR